MQKIYKIQSQKYFTKFPYLNIFEYFNINELIEFLNIDKLCRSHLINYFKILNFYLFGFKELKKLFVSKNKDDQKNLKSFFFNNDFENFCKFFEYISLEKYKISYENLKF